MTINLNYFISAYLPNKKAHSVQVLKMCDELSLKHIKLILYVDILIIKKFGMITTLKIHLKFQVLKFLIYEFKFIL